MRELKHLILQKNVKGGALVFSTSNLLQNMKNRNENLWKHQKRLEKNLTVPKVRKGFFSLVRFCWLRLQWRKWYREPFALRYVPAGWSGSSAKSVHSAYILLADKKNSHCTSGAHFTEISRSKTGWFIYNFTFSKFWMLFLQASVHTERLNNQHWLTRIFSVQISFKRSTLPKMLVEKTFIRGQISHAL